MPKNRSIEPNSARWIMTGRCLLPSAAVYSNSNRSGKLKSSWMVDICQLRPNASRACTELVEPVVAEQLDDEAQQRRQFVAHLVAGAEDVGVVHRQPAHASQPVYHPG